MFYWNAQREGRLRNLYSQGIPLHEIRFALRCTYEALRDKISELGLERGLAKVREERNG